MLSLQHYTSCDCFSEGKVKSVLLDIIGGNQVAFQTVRCMRAIVLQAIPYTNQKG